MQSPDNHGSPSEREVFEAIIAHEDKVVSIPELSEILDCSDPTVRDRLESLEEKSMVVSKQLGSGKGWWIPQEVSSRRSRA
jgi:predicted ArsR family transcriptional regulator